MWILLGELKSWNDTHYYKLGLKYDPSNCHGITLTSCLGKLFKTLLHVGFENEVEKKITLPITSRLQKTLLNDRPYNDFVYLNEGK